MSIEADWASVLKVGRPLSDWMSAALVLVPCALVILYGEWIALPLVAVLCPAMYRFVTSYVSIGESGVCVRNLARTHYMDVDSVNGFVGTGRTVAVDVRGADLILIEVLSSEHPLKSRRYQKILARAEMMERAWSGLDHRN